MFHSRWKKNISNCRMCVDVSIFPKTDDLCDDGRCQDGDTMKRLLRWRAEEVEAIVNDKKMVEGLLRFCHKLQEHLKSEFNVFNSIYFLRAYDICLSI